VIKAKITLTPEAQAALKKFDDPAFQASVKNAMADYLLKKYGAEVQAEQHLVDLCIMDTSWDFVTRRAFVDFAKRVKSRTP